MTSKQRIDKIVERLAINKIKAGITETPSYYILNVDIGKQKQISKIVRSLLNDWSEELSYVWFQGTVRPAGKKQFTQDVVICG